MYKSTPSLFLVFFFNDTAPTEIYTLSLHDALPICRPRPCFRAAIRCPPTSRPAAGGRRNPAPLDRKSTRLNSSHITISYAVFCLKKKKKQSAIDACTRSNQPDKHQRHDGLAQGVST